MTCDQTKGLLADFLDGALPPAAAESVRRHLQSPCDDCLKEAASLSRHLTTCEAPAVDPPAHLKADLLARVAADQRAHAAARRPAVWMAYAATLLAAITLGVTTGGMVRPAAHANDDDAARAARQQAWRQRVAAAQQRFDGGVRPVRQIDLRHEDGPALSLYIDGVGRQVHVLLTDAPPLTPGRTHWVWLLDQEGRHTGAAIQPFEDGRGATVLDLHWPLDQLRQILLTEEGAGEVTQPRGTVHGRWAPPAGGLGPG